MLNRWMPAVARGLQHPGVRRTFALLAVVITIVFLIQTYGRANREHGYDFTSYLLSSQALLQGTNPYDTGSPFVFIYPLFLPVLLVPMTMIPYWLANLLWFVFNVVGMVTAIALFVLRDRSSHMFSWLSFRNNNFAIVIIAFLVFLNTIQNNLLNGQVNFIVVCCCCAFIYFLINENNILAALCLSAAISIKLSPLIFIVFLLLERRYCTVLMTLLFTAIMTIGLPYCFAGSSLASYYGEYTNTFLFKSLGHSSSANGSELIVSLPGFLRYLSPAAFASEWTTMLSMAAIIAVCALIHLRYGSSGVLTTKLMFLLYMISILLITPVSETHHFAYLLVPIVALVVLTTTGELANDAKGRGAFVGFSILYLLGSRFEEQPLYFISIILTVVYLIKMLKDNAPRPAEA